MNFIKRIKQNNQLKKDIEIAKIIGKPLQENIISIIYSVNTNNDVSVLIMERSKWIQPWPNAVQFGIMNKRSDETAVSQMLKNIRDNIAPSIDEIDFQKIIKKVSPFENVNYKLNENFLNINAISFLVEMDDYILKSCVGLSNDEIKHTYFLSLDKIFDLVQKKQNKKLVQPHYADLFWSRKAHVEILQKTK